MINKTPRKFQVRTALVVPFVLQVVVAVGLVGYLSFRNGQDAVNQVTKELRQEIADRIKERLTSYLTTPHLVQQLHANALRLNILNPNDFAQMELFFWQQGQPLSLGISTIAYSNNLGEFVGANKPEGYTVISNAETGRAIRRYAVDRNGKRLKIIREKLNYDARTRGWYKTAVKAGKPVWSKIEPSAIGNRLDISAVTPVFNPQQVLQGVLLTDISLGQISSFLSNLKIGKTGQAFILERSGLIVANSTQEPISSIVGDKDPQRLKASDSKNPILKASIAKLENYNVSNLEQQLQLDLTIDGARHFLQVLPYKDRNGIDWLILVNIPESDFMSQINANSRITVLLCLTTLVLTILIGNLAARSITLPIIRITKASKEIATGNLDERVDTQDFIGIQEVDTLEHSFNSMAGQLKESFASLETKNEELRIAEESYRSIFENALEGIFQSSPEGRYINANPALAKIYGYHSPAEMIESITNIGEQVYVDPQTRDEVRGLLETQETVKGFEYRSYCKDRSMIWTQIDARVVKDMNNNVLYYEGIVQNISDRKRREDDLKMQLAELKIEIDHSKRQKELAILTQSSFFQEVKEEMAEVNLDEFWS